MKILVLFDALLEKDAKKFFNKAKKQVSSELFSLVQLKNGKIEADFGDKIREASHFIAFTNDFTEIFIFILGFAAGRSAFCAYFTDKTDNIPALISENAKLFNKIDDIQAFCKKEFEKFPKKEMILRAREEILNKGIPISAEYLVDFVKKGDTQACALFLKAGFSVNEKSETGVPLLCVAAREGQIKMVNFLLQNNADPNITSLDRGNSAIIDAALGKYSDIISILLKNGADPNIRSKDGQSALIISTGLGDEISVDLLLHAGSSADEPDCLGTSARKYAMLFKKDSIIRLFEKYAENKMK
ncbi:MAG: ankyrin repeat domain-containing protein [Termitinemataceae bacterium]|nr:MAG: ankyrin repeat domain-containing protein [Termitinemataceae bacterium]